MANFGTKKLAVEFFATDAPNPSPLTQNSCLVRFWSFGTGTKTVRKAAGRAAMATFGTKKKKLNFCNRRTQSIPFDPKLMFSAFLEFRFRYEKLCENRPGAPHWTLLV